MSLDIIFAINGGAPPRWRLQFVVGTLLKSMENLQIT